MIGVGVGAGDLGLELESRHNIKLMKTFGWSFRLVIIVLHCIDLTCSCSLLEKKYIWHHVYIDAIIPAFCAIKNHH
jgi:hypothetical protein